MGIYLVLFLQAHGSYSFCEPSDSKVPLHRYYNPATGDHFYTTNWDELGGTPV